MSEPDGSPAPVGPEPAGLWTWIAVALLTGGLAWAGFRPLADLDVWWHIRLGEVMVQTRSLVPSDVFSYTRMGVAWPWKDWGTALLLYGTWSAGGLAGLVVLKGSMLLGSAATLWRTLRHERAIPLSLTVLTIAICGSAASFRYSERGATVSLVVIVVASWLIDRHRAGKPGLVWIVPLAVLNANIHRGVLLLPAVVGALAVVELAETRLLARPRPWVRTGLVALGTGLACLATPFGTRIVTTTVALMGEHSPLITEWAPVEVGLVWRLSPATLAAMGFVAIGGILSVVRSRDPWDAAVLLLAFGLGLQSIRHLPYLALLGAGPAASGWRRLAEHAWTGSLRRVIAIGAGALALFYALGRPLPGPGLGLAPAHYPERGVEFASQQGLSGRVFNEFGYGGFLLFHLWPAQRVYIDGRTDLIYSAQAVERYIASARDPEAFAAEDDTWNFQWAIVDNSPMQGTFGHLDRNPRWALVHASRRALIYVKRGGLNDGLIAEHGYTWLWPHALEASVIAADRLGHGHDALRELERMRADDPDNLYAEIAWQRIDALRSQ